MTRRLRENDFTYLMRELNVEDSQLEAYLNHLRDNFDVYGPFCAKSLEKLQDMLKFKIETMPHFQFIFPKYVTLRKRLEKCNDYIGQRRNVEDKDRNTDILYHHYVKEMMNRLGCTKKHVLNRGNASLPIAEFIGEEMDFEKVRGEDVRWRQIYSQIG